MEVKEIVEQYLRTNNYGGLYSGYECGCGCEIDDLMPCDSNCAGCHPGYKVLAKDFTPDDLAEWDGYNFIICDESRPIPSLEGGE